MRYLAIGDIHGCFQALRALEAAVPFQPDDVLVTLGDYVDRGPDSRAVLDWLIDYGQKNPGRLVCLRGNHEIMMLNARKGGVAFPCWFNRGGEATLMSYGLPLNRPEALLQIPEAHWRFLESSLRPYFEIDTHFFVHANASPEVAIAQQTDYMLYWEHFEAAAPHTSGKIMVCGHTSQFSGVPRNYGYAVCIDTRAFGGNWLTCLDVATGHYWQANQQGHVREGHVDDLLVDQAG